MADTLTLTIDGVAVRVPDGITVAAALALSANGITRRSVTGQLRAPVCGMGICQECRVTIDGRAHQLACQTRCMAGMAITTGVSVS